MKHPLLIIAAVFLCNQQVIAQNCANCTSTISTTITSAVHVNQGDKLCITSTGSINAALYILNGEVCNEGNIGGAVFFDGGTLDNYHTIHSSTNINMTAGILNNFGSIQASQLSFNGGEIRINNHGPMTGNNLQLQEVNAQGNVALHNYDSVGISSYLSDSSVFNNYGIMTVTGQLTNGTGAEFYNYNGLSVGANFTNSNYFYTECMIPVGGLWTNNASGTIGGSLSGCGGFTANLSTSNFGNFGMAGGHLDMCDTSNMGSFNFNTGNTGPNVTYCTCTTICPASFPVSLNKIDDRPIMQAFPNPSTSHVYIQMPSSKTLGKVKLYDMLGTLLFMANVQGNSLSLDMSTYPSGIYLLKGEYGSIKLMRE